MVGLAQNELRRIEKHAGDEMHGNILNPPVMLHTCCALRDPRLSRPGQTLRRAKIQLLAQAPARA